MSRTIEALKESNSSFGNAYETYTDQYGRDVIQVCNPLDLGETVDPVAIILGRNCVVYYYDSRKSLVGSLGSLELDSGIVYIVGRREPQDSKLVAWSPTDGREVELGEYNPSASRIPSRVHSAVMVSSERTVYFTDLCSSAGTIVVGESSRSGAFVRAYDPGSSKFPTINFERISTTRKV